MIYAKPGSPGALFTFESRYPNFIGGEWVAPKQGAWFENITPVTGNCVLRTHLRNGSIPPAVFRSMT